MAGAIVVGTGSDMVTFSGRLVDWGVIQLVSSFVAIGVGNGFVAWRGVTNLARATGLCVAVPADGGCCVRQP